MQAMFFFILQWEYTRGTQNDQTWSDSLEWKQHHNGMKRTTELTQLRFFTDFVINKVYWVLLWKR